MVRIKKYNPLFLYLLSIVIVQIGTIVRLQLDNQTLGNFLRIIGVLILLISLCRQINIVRVLRLNFCMRFLLFWNTFNILFTLLTEGLNLTRVFGEESYLLAYILPYLLVYDVSTINLNKIFNFSIMFALFALIIIFLNYEYLMMANNIYYITSAIDNNLVNSVLAQIPIMWSIPASIIFMNLNFVSKKKVIISLIVYVLAISFSMALGRRGTSLYGILFLLAGFWMYIRNSSYRLSRRVHVSIILALFLLGCAYFAMDHFSFLVQRGFEDSRSSVNEAFFDDLDISDFILGRGLNGTYYDPMNIFDAINNRRPDHETGMLNIILHAGLLFLIPYLLICVSSIYKGYFKSNNTLIKSFSVYILINTLMLLVGSYPAFNLRFFILWIGILLCNNASFRRMDNKEIANYFILSR